MIYPLYHILREHGETSIITTGNEVRIMIPPEDTESINLFEKSKWFAMLVNYLIREYFPQLLLESFYESMMFLNSKYKFFEAKESDDSSENEKDGLAGSYVAFALAQIKFTTEHSNLKSM